MNVHQYFEHFCNKKHFLINFSYFWGFGVLGMAVDIWDHRVARVNRRFGGAHTYHIRTSFKEELQNCQLYDIDRDGNDRALLLEVRAQSIQTIQYQ